MMAIYHPYAKVSTIPSKTLDQLIHATPGNNGSQTWYIDALGKISPKMTQTTKLKDKSNPSAMPVGKMLIFVCAAISMSPSRCEFQHGSTPALGWFLIKTVDQKDRYRIF